MSVAGGLVMYGIANCDTVRKARGWLDARGVVYRFHDYKKSGVTAALLARWIDAVGWEVLLNRAGTTFRKLEKADRDAIDEPRAIALMIAQPSMIKRPVLDGHGTLLIGFKPEAWHASFS